LRRRLRQFEQDGWIVVARNDVDQRNFLVSPTERMLTSYAEYFRLVATLSREVRVI